VLIGRGRKKTELEMLDGTEVVRVVEVARAEPVAEDAKSAAEAGGHPIDDIEDADDECAWEEWDSS
jgi:hypothetical protein